jgi:hypothetical protein
MIAWKVYWSVGGAVATFTAVMLMALFGFPTLLGIAFLLVAAVVVIIIASKFVAVADVFSEIDDETRSTFTRLLGLAAVLHVVWGAAFLLQTSLWPVWSLALVGLAGLEYGTAHGHEYLLKRRPKSRELVAVKVEQAKEAQAQTHAALELARTREIEAHRPRLIFEQALAEAKYDWLTVRNWNHIGRDNRLVGAWFDVRIPSRSKLETAGKKGHAELKLGGADVEPLAIALADELGLPIESNWVTINKKREAGMYRISVLTENVMAKVIVYQDRLEWASIADPALVGYQIDGEPYAAHLDQHWADVGMSRSGKTSLINVKIARVTLCHDAVLWLCGTEKLVDLAWPWVKRYMNKGLRLPIDWIASGPWDTVRMLVAAFRVARWRQRVPPEKRADFKTIIVQLDEASFVLGMMHVYEIYGDQKLTPSEAAQALVKGAGSAGVHLHIASQRGTNDNWGLYGGDINANMAVQTVFYTNDPAEVGRATGDFQLPIPQNKGEFWLRPGVGDPVLKLKAPYIQEDDPKRKKLHDGPMVSEIAWSRRHFVVDLDAGSARAAGEHYARRFTTATPELFAYLTGGEVDAEFAPEDFDSVDSTPIPTATGAPAPAPAGARPQLGGGLSRDEAAATEEVNAALDEMFAQLGLNPDGTPLETAASTPAETVAQTPSQAPAEASPAAATPAPETASNGTARIIQMRRSAAKEDPQQALPMDLGQPVHELSQPQLPAPSPATAGTGAPAPAPSGSAVATMTNRPPLKERILAVLSDANEPMTRADIIAALTADGSTISEQTVTNALGELVKTGVLTKPDGRNSYAKAS